jgi:multidrug efflux pump subunit AcrA (membrane-fusion protein)
MRLRGTVEVGRQPDVLLVPEDAVFAQPDGAVVFVKTLLGEREVRPTFGERNKEAFAAVDGLSEGDRVRCRGSADS